MKQVQGINTGSMADIAFLLLVFFLVTTNINQDFAINSNISKPFEVPDSLSIHRSTLLINSDGKYMLNEMEIGSADLGKELAAGFNTSDAMKNVLLVKTDRDVSYAAFISALDNSKKAFKLFYNELSIAQHNQDFGMLDDSLQLRLKTLHPVALAEDVLEN